MISAKYLKVWLAGRPENTRRSYTRSLGCFERMTGIPVDEASKLDVNDWKRMMDEQGNRPRTINNRVAGLSSYYEWCIKSDVRMDNPAHVHRVKLPNQYEFKGQLSADEAGRLLNDIRRRQLMARNEVTRIRALQDYALFLGYMMMGLRNREWARARVEDFDVTTHAPVVMYQWYGKGKAGWQEVPEPVWEAIQEYTKAVYLVRGELFFALGVSAENLGREVRGCLSGTEVNRRLHYYARRAGVEKDGLRVHALKHTAIQLLHSTGAGKDECQMFGKHSNGATTEIYLGEQTGVMGYDWRGVAEKIGV